MLKFDPFGFDNLPGRLILKEHPPPRPSVVIHFLHSFIFIHIAMSTATVIVQDCLGDHAVKVSWVHLPVG